MEVFFYYHLSKLGGKLVFLGNLSKKDATKLNVKDNFQGLTDLQDRISLSFLNNSFKSVFKRSLKVS